METPTTDDLVPVLSFRLGTQHYALLIADVVEVAAMVEMVKIADSRPEVVGMVNRHGAPLPLLDLRAIFGQPTPPPTDSTLFVVVDDGSRMAGLVLDEVYQVVYLTAEQLRGPSAAEGYIRCIISHKDELVQVIALKPLLAAYVTEQITDFEA